MDPVKQAQIDSLKSQISQLNSRIDGLLQEVAQAGIMRARLERILALHKRTEDDFYTDHDGCLGEMHRTAGMWNVRAAQRFSEALREGITGGIDRSIWEDFGEGERAIRRGLARINEDAHNKESEAKACRELILDCRDRIRRLSQGW